MMTRMTPTVSATRLGLCALLILAAGACSSSDDGVDLLADTLAGQTLTILEVHGDPTIWVSSESGADPRPGGRPDPGLCRVSGGGSPRLVEPEGGTSRLGETTLYPVAAITGLEPPADVTCSGPGFKHVYVGTR